MHSKTVNLDKCKEKAPESKVAGLATGDDELLFSDPQQKI
jgi:hypothetical protein